MSISDNKLSIILPIKDRKGYSLRVLEFLNNEKCQYAIYVADGSKIKNFKQSLLINKFKNLNITYKYHGHDRTFSKFINKIHSYRYLIKSKYVYWLCDDDFPNLETLKQGINKLDKNKKFSAYVGQVKNFSLNKKKLKFSNKFLYYYPSSIKKIFSSNNILNRLKKYSYYQPFEGILNTSVFFKVFEESRFLKIDNYHEFALIFKTIPLLYGKIFIEKKIILIRQENSYTSEGKKLSIFIDDEINKIYQTNFKKIVCRLVDIISNNLNLKSNEKEKIFKVYYENIIELYNYTINKTLMSFYKNKIYIVYTTYKKIFNKINFISQSKSDYISKDNFSLFQQIKKFS